MSLLFIRRCFQDLNSELEYVQVGYGTGSCLIMNLFVNQLLTMILLDVTVVVETEKKGPRQIESFRCVVGPTLWYIVPSLFRDCREAWRLAALLL